MKDVLINAALAGGNILKTYFKQNLSHFDKTSYKDFYTVADLESQKAIKKTILEEISAKGIGREDTGFIGEEKLYEPRKRHLFIIDPLDGTVNFANGFDHFAVSIGYFKDGSPEAGVVLEPTSGALYFAAKGKGSFKNDQRLKILPQTLKNSFVNGYFSSFPEVSRRLIGVYNKLLPDVKAFRSLQCMALDNCLLADNIFNLIINGHTSIWDIAAVKLIIEEAGGGMYDLQGLPVKYELENPGKAYEVFSCHPVLKEEIIGYFK
jgi:myo-inositol-1(or 4)-monophosphatase